MSCHAGFHALIGRPQGREICPTGQSGDPEESSPIQGRRSSIQEGRFQREGRGRPRCCFRGETKGQFNHAAWQMSREEGCGHRCRRPEGVRSGWLHDAAEDRKRIRCSTCGQPSPSFPSKGKSGRGSKHQLKPPSTSPGQASSTAPSTLCCTTDSGTSIYARTCTLPCASGL